MRGDPFDYEQIIVSVLNQLPAEGIDAPNVLNNIERNLVIAALDRCAGMFQSQLKFLVCRGLFRQKMNKFNLNQNQEK